MSDTQNSNPMAPQSQPRKGRRMSLQDWQAGGGVNGEWRTEVPRAEQLRKAQMEALESELMKPRSPWGACSLANGIVWPNQSGGEPHLLTEIKLFELTGEEYNLLNDEDSTYYAKVHAILGNCIKQVATKDGAVTITDPRIIANLPYSMMFLDRLLVMYALRRLAQGDVYPFVHVCPKCKKDDLYAVDLRSIGVTPMEDPLKRTFTTVLPSGAVATWHVLCGSDERGLTELKEADRKKNSLTNSVAARVDSLTFEFPERKTVQMAAMSLPQKVKEVNKLGGRDIQHLWDQFDEVEGDLDSKVDLKCKFCSHEFSTETHTRGEGFFFPLLLLRNWKKNSSSV